MKNARSEPTRRRLLPRPVHLLPIDAPAAVRNFHPYEPLDGRVTRVVVEHSGALIKAPRVRRIAKAEALAVEGVAEFVAERAEERAVGRHLLAHGGARPDTDQHSFGRVVGKKLGSPAAFAGPQGPGGQHAHLNVWYAVEIGCYSEKFKAGTAHRHRRAILYHRLNCFRGGLQVAIRRQIEIRELVARKIFRDSRSLARGPVGDHAN